MKFETVKELTEKAVAQTLGSAYMTAEDGNIRPLESFRLADVGKDVLDSGSVDSYVKSLLTQIGKLIIYSDKYKAELPSLFVDSFDWGGYIERVYFSPQDIVEDDMYALVDGKSYDDHKFYKPNVSAKIFEEAKTLTCPISITRDAVAMAFTNMDEMNRFLSGIYTNVENTITLGMEAYAHMLVSCGIAVSIGATSTARHLATEYYGEGFDKTAHTLSKMLKDKDFLRYCLEQISLTKDRFKRYTTAFNNKSIPVFTNESQTRLALLSDFTTACKFNVSADTFNKEEIGIGSFDKISSWQAFADAEKVDFDVTTNSTISISADAENKLGIGTGEFTKSGIIGILYDYRAMGICPQKTKVTSNYTASADFWNHYHHQLLNYILDPNFSMVAFVLD